MLLVEDDQEVAALTREMLTELGFSVIHVTNPAAALGALADGRSVDIVFSDIMMPGGVSGVELAREIRRRYPSMPIVLATGYSESAAGVEDENFKLLLKPYTAEALAGALSVNETRSPPGARSAVSSAGYRLQATGYRLQATGYRKRLQPPASSLARSA